MSELELLRFALSQFAQLVEDDFNLSLPCWKIKRYKKGDLYNPYGSICRYLGITIEGYFRTNMTDEKGDEKNIFLFLRDLLLAGYGKEFPANNAILTKVHIVKFNVDLGTPDEN